MKTRIAAEAVLTEIANADIVDLCNKSLISLLDERALDSEGLRFLDRVHREFSELTRSKLGEFTLDEIALTGADLFENCLPEFPYQVLQATADLIAYGEKLPEGYTEHLDIIGQCELALIVIAERLWQTLTEEIAFWGIFPAN